MKKKNQSEKKLSLKKLQMAKISNSNKIFGGIRQNTDCADPQNTSSNHGDADTGL